MSKGTFGFGMLIGAVTGYAAAIFLAPKPGDATKKEWQDKAEEYFEKAKEQSTQLKEKVSSGKDSSSSDDITVYSTTEGVGDPTDALAVGDDPSIPGGLPSEQEPVPAPAPVTPEAPLDGVAEDVRYREADPLDTDIKL